MIFKVNTFFLTSTTFCHKKLLFFILFSIMVAYTCLSQSSRSIIHKAVYYGKASYYDEDFNGHKTANGETFSHRQLTAAHLSWPFNTKVKITNLANNNTVVVRINDRGPFVNGRHIDVSKQAAKVLGFLRSGVVEVKMEVLKWGTPHTPDPMVKATENDPDANTINSITRPTGVSASTASTPSNQHSAMANPSVSLKPKEEPKADKWPVQQTGFIPCANADSLTGWCVQIGSYGSRANAERTLGNVVELTKEWACIQEIQRGERTLYRVICGKRIENGRAYQIKLLLAKKYPDAFVTNYITLLNNGAMNR